MMNKNLFQLAFLFYLQTAIIGNASAPSVPSKEFDDLDSYIANCLTMSSQESDETETDPRLQFRSIIQFETLHQPYYIEQRFWGTNSMDKGKMFLRMISDEKGSLQSYQACKYDKYHQILEEKRYPDSLEMNSLLVHDKHPTKVSLKHIAYDNGCINKIVSHQENDEKMFENTPIFLSSENLLNDANLSSLEDIINVSTHCSSHRRHRDCCCCENTAGPAGPAGPQGPAGPAGSAGPMGPTGPTGLTPTDAWLTSGNAGTTSTNFLGTTDNQALRIVTNNNIAGATVITQAGQIQPLGTNGSVLIGAGVGTGPNDVFIGANSGLSNSTGTMNTAVGTNTLSNNSSANTNTAFGANALFRNLVSDNVAVGANALSSNSSGTGNTATGFNALAANVSGTGNSAFGDSTLSGVISTINNTAMGFHALSATTASNNTAFGAHALETVLASGNNTAVGTNALSVNQSTNNTAVGSNCLANNTTGINNTAVGFQALQINTTGSNLTAVGTNALANNISAGPNTAFGFEALLSNTTGTNNVAFGYQALRNNTTGSNNLAFGGQLTLATNITGSNNTCLGTLADVSVDGLTNATALGYLTIVNASNKVRLGNTTVGTVEGQVAYSFPSDGRFKIVADQTVPGLAFITRLRPVLYRIDKDKEAAIMHVPDTARSKELEEIQSQILRTGFIAQEVEQAALDIGYDFDGVIKPENEDGYYGLAYSSFVVPLVKAFQEQQVMIEENQMMIEELKARFEKALKMK